MYRFQILCFLLAAAVAAPLVAESARLRILIRDESNNPAWARLEVRDPASKLYQPAEDSQVIRDRTARTFPGTKPYYIGHFVARSEVRLEVPAGEYTVIAERGPEHTRVQHRVVTGAGKEIRVVVAPRRWIDMNRQGWWSADFHVHRPLEELPALMETEDLNLAVVLTMWKARNLWEGRSPPPNGVLRQGARHVASVMNAEDERGGGAWMLHNLKRPLALGAADRWFPQGKIFVEQARAQGAWFDMEKPLGWEAPVMTALVPPDSWGVVNNHFDQYGIYASEAGFAKPGSGPPGGGRPRDTVKFPGPEGFVAYCLDLYYRYLNLGFKLPASAGSASGAVPNPVGRNRAYAYVGKTTAFEPDEYYAAMRAGRTFATNGPMLFLRVNDRLPGDTLEVRAGEGVTVEVQASAREPIARVELIANGEMIHAWAAGATSTKQVKVKRKLNLVGYTWLAARCFLVPGDTIDLAHTSPVYLSSPINPNGRRSDVLRDAQYFIQWLDELISLSGSEKGRFQNETEKSEVLAIYRKALAVYTNYAATSTAELPSDRLKSRTNLLPPLLLFPK